MKLLGLEIRPRHDRTELVIKASPQEALNIQSLVSRLGEIDGDYDVIIKKKKDVRSKDQNAYMWELIRQLAIALNLPSDECYRHIVRDYGLSDVIAVRTENMAFWKEAWESQGIGYQFEDLGECRTNENGHNVRLYLGTSNARYTTDVMARLLDGLIEECKLQSIETMTPDQLNELRRLENEHSTTYRKTHSQSRNIDNTVRTDSLSI